ncbi:CDP-glycerol glycerophosphotransferase family protein [Streptomyces sp. NBC_01500]|uniref:CDP-glycerol glycerophosphotransferase family protein n=1 Tax=Streptomyces sp. NBC_01500 TaxID=2903886 RepID=UPI00224D251C|nr:CDP-glycerol glycerophosphotransferase family protein [Streptomyces sp. NBC_01500]MCX4551767.1 CDP-glycerol glycerophosphotransferase family protein [Streptomyces sp. NBC_01500]
MTRAASREPRAASREPRAASREPRAASRERWLRVPVGEDPERWRTLPGKRLVVAVARTVTSTVRVLDVLRPVLRDDPRVDVVFAYDPTSAFNHGVEELLRTVGARVMPWGQLASAEPDLIVTATENARLPGVCPVLVLPHGVGFHKTVPDSRSTRERLAGLVPAALLRSGRARLAVSHPSQAAQLTAAHPAADGLSVLIGDPCYDALLEGRNLRARYRDALGVGPERRLVMLSTTWREESTMGSQPGLPARLLAELPRDEYAVALVSHPNVQAAHGSYQVETVLASARGSGLLRIPPAAGWQGTLLAADLLIGDHGSVTFYGAALGTPLLLGAFSEHEVVPGTPMAELGQLAPRLVQDAPLRAQIERTLSEHQPDRFRKLGESAFADPGHALGNLRTVVYEQLRLDPCEGPPPPRLAPVLPVPQPDEEDTTASVVVTRVVTSQGDSRIVVERFPASVAHLVAEPDTDRTDTDSTDTDSTDIIFRYVSCGDDARDQGVAESASVLVRRTAAPTAVAAARWAENVFARYPGALLAASSLAGGCCRVRLTDGRTVEVSTTGRTTDAGMSASAVYSCLRAGLPLAGFLTLCFAGREEDVTLRLLP